MTHTTYNNTKSMFIVGSIVTLSMLALTNPAAAYQGHYQMPQSNDITVSSENSAAVVNEVMVGANTGYNGIAGGNTGAAGNGGSARGNDATGGNGGTSGDSQNDGVIATGNASAIGIVNNDVNSNRTKVTKNCGCENRTSGDVSVWSGNNAIVGNALGVDANTGDNVLAGGTSGAAGNGGDASSKSAHSWSKWNHHMQNGSATGGNGGNTGTSANIGTVITGQSIAAGSVVNVVNRNVTRIR